MKNFDRDEEVSIQPKGKLEVLPGASNIGDGIDLNTNIPAVEYKKGYVMRKCCYESNHKKSKFNFITELNRLYVVMYLL